MSAVLDYPHITKPPGGSAHLERLPRIRVAMIVEMNAIVSEFTR